MIWTDKEKEYLQTHLTDPIESLVAAWPAQFGRPRNYDSIDHQIRRMMPPQKPKKIFIADPDAPDFRLQIQHDRLKKDYGELSSKYKIVTGMLADQDMLVECISDKLSGLPPAPYKPLEISTGKGLSETVLALFSDTHAGEDVKKEEINGLNEFNFDILNNRTKLWAEKVVDIPLRKLSGMKFQKIVVGMLGDMLSGTIHEELLRGAEGSIVDWTVDYAYIVSQALRDIAAAYPKVEVSCVVGNHGRLFQKPVFKAKYAGWDYMFYKQVELHLKDQKNITFNIPRSFWTIHNIEGWNFLFIHGDNIRSWNGVPWYGINRAIAQLKELLEAKDDQFQYSCFGHFHQLATLDRAKGQAIINGSVIGLTEYSVGKIFTGNRAKQFLCGVHPKWGKTWSYDIDLQEPPNKGYIYDKN